MNTDGTTVYSNPNPKLYANFLSRLLFSWLFPLFNYGKYHDLEAKDLYNVLSDDLSESLGDRLESCWNAEILNAGKYNKRRANFLKAIFNALGWSYVKYGIHVFLVNVLGRATQLIVLESLISRFDASSSTTTWDVCKYALILVCLMIVQIVLAQHASYGLNVIGMRLRIACSSLIYRKMTRLSCSSIQYVSRSSIVDLLSSDVTKFNDVFISLHHAWIIPLQATAMAYLVWQRVGLAVFAGTAFMIVTTIPVQFVLDEIISKLRKELTAVIDKRIVAVSALISSIGTIKMYVWEKPLEKLVSTLRRKEIHKIQVCSYVRGTSLASLMFVNQTSLFFTLLVYVLQGYAIDATRVYVIVYYYYYLRLALTHQFPAAVKSLVETRGSIDRMQQFLLLPEVNKHPNKTSSASSDENTKGTVSIANVNAKWSENSIAHTLHDVNVNVAPKKLYALVGAVDSGKSSFMKMILGELRSSSGEVSISGTISYASQEPWLFTGSIRDNVIFGENYDETRYRQVVSACALEEDFEQLSRGDRSLIGDRTVVLNASQRTRINLARAVYRESDIYLLDDPLSSFDNHVGKQLFDDCIDGLLKNKTRILVTHQVQYLKKADVIVFFNNGQIEFQGSFDDFRKKEIFEHLPPYTVIRNYSQQSARNILANSTLIQNTPNEGDEDESQETTELMGRKTTNRLLFLKYLKTSRSYLLIFSTIACFALAQILLSGSIFWIAHWTQTKESRFNESISTDTFQDPDDTFALWTLGHLTFLGVLASLVANVLFLKTCLVANEKIHKKMLMRLVGAPMLFFDSNPTAKIINWFSKDIVDIDENLPVKLLHVVQSCSITIGTFAQVLIVNWLMAFPLLVVLYLYKKLKDVYFNTAQNLNKLEAVAKSPMFSLVTSSLSGLTTIRSCNAESFFRRKFDFHQDNHTSAYFLAVASSIAFSFWIDVVSLLFVALVSFSFVIVKNYAASYVGLAITQAVGLYAESVQSCMKNYGDCVAPMTAVERMFQVVEIEQEASYEVEIERPPLFWPERAEITFSNVSLRYSENSQAALKDVSCCIKAGEKVGIVGRTGSGKSSLITALFRLANIEGSIFIDDIDIRKIDLVRLREKISIISQNPVIFTTTVRENLDAYNRFQDSLLWSVLDTVELKPIISSLDMVLDDGGARLSVGQRRLLCLARTILETNRILILDEATSNVDAVTEELFKRIVRRNFKDCTVITIAHKLNSVLDNDRVIVMDRGRLVEYDKPSILLERKGGHLAEMVKQTKREMTEHLRRIAEQAGNEVNTGENDRY